MNEGLVSVTFTRGCAPYQAGEVAGFEPGEAERLVSTLGVADYTDPKQKAPPGPPADKQATESARKGGNGRRKKGGARKKKAPVRK